MPCRPPGLPPAERLALRRKLEALDAPNCDCPAILSCPCRQECPGGPLATCPGCRHDLQGGGPGTESQNDPPCSKHCPHCREDCDCHPAMQGRCQHTSPNAWRLTNDELCVVLTHLALEYLPHVPTPRRIPADPEAVQCRNRLLLGRLWEVADPRAHAEPSGRPKPSGALLQQHRVEEYVARRRNRQTLWGADLWRRDPLQLQDVQLEGCHLRNGYDNPEEAFAGCRPPPPSVHDRWHAWRKRVRLPGWRYPRLHARLMGSPAARRHGYPRLMGSPAARPHADHDCLSVGWDDLEALRRANDDAIRRRNAGKLAAKLKAMRKRGRTA